MNTLINLTDRVQAAPAGASFPGALAAAALALGAVCMPASAAVLYSQLDNPSGEGYSTQIFEPSFTAYDAMGADDFVVTGDGWNVNEVRLVTSTTTSVTQGTANISFYDNSSGLPGNLLQQFLAAPFAGGVASLGGGIDLTPGVYWLGVSFDREFGSGGGQIFWMNRTTQTGFTGVWQNPGNGFGTGCTTWAPVTVCVVVGGANPDYLFELSGDRLTNQVPEPATLALVLAALGGIGLSRRRRS